MFDKKILAAAVAISAALLFPSGAFAQVDLTGPAAPVFVGQELTPAAGPPVSVTIDDSVPGAIYDIVTTVGVAISAESGVQRYARFDIAGDGATFVAPLGGALSGRGGTAVPIVGNLGGLDNVIVEVTETGNGVSAADTVTLTLGGLNVASTGTDIVVSTATYADLGAAAAQTGALATDSGTLVDFIASGVLSFTATATAPQATMASDFLAFAVPAGCPAADTGCSDTASGNMGNVLFTTPFPGAVATFDATGNLIAIIGDLVGAGTTFTVTG